MVAALKILCNSAAKTHNAAIWVVMVLLAFVVIVWRDVAMVSALGTILGVLYGANAIGSFGHRWLQNGGNRKEPTWEDPVP